MPDLEEQRVSPERLVFFSDAVVAIALTLLTIELPVPDASSEHAFFASIRTDSGHYAAFLVSFIVVAVAWRNHRRTFVLIKTDSTFEVLNFVWLFTVAIMPFAAKLLTFRRHSEQVVHACCFGFYSLTQAVSTGVLILMLHRARRNGHLEPGSDNEAAALERTCAGFTAGFGLSIPLFFATNAAWVLWIVVPGLVAFAERARRRRTPRPAGG